MNTSYLKTDLHHLLNIGWQSRNPIQLPDYSAISAALKDTRPAVNDPTATYFLDKFNGADSLVMKVALAINTFHETNAIYMFGRHSYSETYQNMLGKNPRKNNRHHFYFLVICKDTYTNLVADMADYVKTHVPTTTVTILLHKPSEVFFGTKRCRNFFYQLLENGILIYQRKNTEFPELMNIERNFSATRKYWQRCAVFAETFLEASGCDESDPGQPGIAMLQIAVEQVLLGVIEVRLGYRPRHYALGYLMDICACFTRVFDMILPRITEEDQKLFKILSGGLNGLRHSATVDFNLTYNELLHLRCAKLYTVALEMVNVEFLKWEVDS